MELSTQSKEHNCNNEDPKPDQQLNGGGQALYTDGLHSVFKFLTLNQLAPAILTCRSWRSAAYKERGRGVHLAIHPMRWPELSFSPLHHHIASLDGTLASCNIAEVKSLAHFPALCKLKIKLDLQHLQRCQQATTAQEQAVAAKFVALQWPQHLQTLAIQDIGAQGVNLNHDAAALQTVIDLVCHLPSITYLSLNVQRDTDYNYDFAPLKRLTRLIDLWLGMVVHDNHLDQLKTLSTLDWIGIGESWSVSQLEHLCTPPHQLDRLSQLTLRKTNLTVAHMQHLLHLPGLQFLIPHSIALDALEFISRIPQLKHLRVRITGDERPHAVVFLVHLKLCTNIVRLDLSHCVISDEEMRELLKALPLLANLCLSDIDDLPDLRCLASAPSLLRFAIQECPLIRSLQLMQLIPACATLRNIDLQLPAADVAFARQLFQPPSTFLPQLTTFTVRAL